MSLVPTKTNINMQRIAVLIGFSAILTASTWCAAVVPEVKLASEPLLNGSGNVHPNLLLSLSAAFPAIGAAYRGDAGGYDKTLEYIGYFNPANCYAYAGRNRNISDGYFSIAKVANAMHECGGDSFSGNFMNWAASSLLDILRYALTGGDRIVDTAQMTILQRAVLKEDFYANDNYFPRKILKSGGNASAPNQVTPFNADTLHIVSCRNRILFSDSANSGNNCDTPAFDKQGMLAKTDKTLGEYLVRVSVCDRTEGPSRTDLCRQYGSSYKPTGEMQRHAESMRIAAMGYLMDDSSERYGGVLRAPMKYIGSKKFDAPGFNEAANENLEWDVATGVLVNNPDDKDSRASATSNSGAINYLNRFGRSGQYKTFDPVSELYYEGIRYLQGKQPTPEATAGMTTAMKDGFPAIENWQDPVTVACQKNYILSIADANTHFDRYLPGNRRTTLNGGKPAYDRIRAADAAIAYQTPELDVKSWTAKIAEMEADMTGRHANPAPRPNLADLQNKDTGAGGHGTYYMAGLAYWANTNDIRLDKPVRVKTFAIDVDEGGNGSIDASSRETKPRDSQLYLAAKYGGFDDKNNDGNPFVTYAADGETVVKANNSEWDRNDAGKPANYFLGSRPEKLLQAIRKVFSTIARGGSAVSGVTVSATKFISDGAFVYQAGFDASTWSGSLKKMAITLDQNGIANIAPAADWDAGNILTGINGTQPKPGPDARNIHTLTIKADKSMTTTPFRWDALSAAQRILLDTSPDGNVNDGLGKKRLDYLRGVRKFELGQPDGIFRARESVLGDIIHSNPLFVGPPASVGQDNAYQQFYDDHKDRAKAVYVGANDGMLHAFHAVNGDELFAYMPNALLQNVNQLAAPEYVHRPYVDGMLSVAEALVGEKWKTVLASGMGGGAQGVFALDVTNPADFSSGSGALWEFTDHDDADMGNLVSAPLIAKFKTKVVKGIPEYKYFVIVPGGVNNYKDDGNGKFDAAAPGALFLLSLDKDPSVKWKQGVNYYKFKMPISSDTMQNGVASPALVLGSDGAVRFAYAGDLQGNLWRFNFKDAAPWAGALGSSPYKPLFTASDEKNNRQPITSQPKVVYAPGSGYVVLFGTGKFMEQADAASGSFKTQSFYGIHDTAIESYNVADRSELAARSAMRIMQKSSGAMDSDALDIAGASFTYGATGEGKKGWYVDLPASDRTGERIVTNSIVAHGRLFFNSFVPGNDPCAGNEGRSYMLDTLTGLPFNGKATGYLSEMGLSGLSSAPLLFEMDVEVGDKDAIGKRPVKKKYGVFNPGAGAAKKAIVPIKQGITEINPPAGRFSWREVINWQELRDAVNKK